MRRRARATRVSRPELPIRGQARRVLAYSRREWPREVTRTVMMQRIEDTAPSLLETLAAVPSVDAEGNETAEFREWAGRWRVPGWLRHAARSTWRLWRDWPSGRGRKWGVFDLYTTGELVPNAGHLPRSRDAVFRADHIDWWIRSRLLRESYEAIAEDVGRVKADTIGRAVRALDLTLGDDGNANS